MAILAVVMLRDVGSGEDRVAATETDSAADRSSQPESLGAAAARTNA